MPGLIPEMMRIRVEASGPRSWQSKIFDADTGKSLPVKAGTAMTIHIPPEAGGAITIDVCLVLSELVIDELPTGENGTT